MLMDVDHTTFSPGDICSLSPNGVDSGYHSTRERISRLLIRNTLVESYRRFAAQKQPYPFVDPHNLRPGSASSSKEFHLHNSALVVLINGHLPEKLRKHFRCRTGNLMRMKNLVEVAPDLTTLDEYRPQQRFSTHPGFETLLEHLLPLDFSLLVQQSLESDRQESVYELSHFHVKIERILDNALRSLGVDLNYLQSGLYEKGDEFVEKLEKKFFEYYNFYHNSAGRRSAATIAAQLLAREHQEGTVFITSQQERRLTLFSTVKDDDAPLSATKIEHFTLLLLDGDNTHRLREWGQDVGLNILRDYMVARNSHGGIFILKTQFEHTPVACPTKDGRVRSDINVREKWVRLLREEIVSVKPSCPDVIHFPCVYQNGINWKKVRKISPCDQ